MNNSFKDATAAEVASAIESRLAGIDVTIDVLPRELDVIDARNGSFAFVVVATMPNGVSRRFVANHVTHRLGTSPTFEELVNEFVKQILPSCAFAPDIARQIAETRAAAEAVFADPNNIELGLRLVDVTPKLCDVTLPDDVRYLTVEMTEYDDQLKIVHSFFETDGAADAGSSIRNWMPEQHMRHTRANALRAAGAAGVADIVTLRLLDEVGLTLNEVLRRLGSHEKVSLNVWDSTGPTGMIVHRFDGIITCECKLNADAFLKGDVLTLYDEAGRTWAAQAKLGDLMKETPGDCWFAGMMIEGVDVGQSRAFVRIELPLVYYDAKGEILGAAPQMALRDRSGRTILLDSRSSEGPRD